MDDKIIKAGFDNRSLGLFVCLVVIVLGLLTHGYAFFDAAYTHDALNALYADPVENEWKISLGRVCKPMYEMLIRGDFAIPWLIGCLSLLWVSIAAYLVVRIFEMKSWICIVLTCGIMVTNLTFTLTAATYIHDLDANMFALMLSVLAAYQWNKTSRISPVSILCISLSLGFYQSYVSVCIVLMLMRCMMDIFQGKSFKKNFLKGMTSCVVLLLGAAVYAVLLVFIQYCTEFTMNTGTGNGLQNMAAITSEESILILARSYVWMFSQLFYAMISMFPLWLVMIMHLFFGIGLLACVSELIRGMHGFSIKNILLCIFLVSFVPPAVFLSSILSGGSSLHFLMLYALWLIYVPALIIVDRISLEKKSKILEVSRFVVMGIVAILIWGNIRTANTIYLIKDMQSEASYSLMTRVVGRMEESEEYVTGVTPVAFIGQSSLIAPISGIDRYAGLVGVNYNLLKRNPQFSYDPVFKLVANRLGNPLVICNDETYMQLIKDQGVIQMPCYPDEGCMRLINGIFVVKLGN